MIRFLALGCLLAFPSAVLADNAAEADPEEETPIPDWVNVEPLPPEVDPLAQWYGPDRRRDIRIPDFTPMTSRYRLVETVSLLQVRVESTNNLPYVCPYVRVTVELHDQLGVIGSFKRQMQAVRMNERMEWVFDVSLPLDHAAPYEIRTVTMCWRSERLANPRSPELVSTDLEEIDDLDLFSFLRDGAPDLDEADTEG